jgi:hypothetical protein
MRATLHDAILPALEQGTDEAVNVLPELLVSIEDRLRTLSDVVTYFYFSHADLHVS